MKPLVPFQKEAVQKIIQFYYSSQKHGRISIATGLGHIKILTSAIYEILTKNIECKILYLCNRKELVEQIKKEFLSFPTSINVVDRLEDLKENGIFIIDYKSISTSTNEIDYNFFDFIICDTLEFLKEENAYPFYSSAYKKKRLSISSTPYSNPLAKNDELIFEYNLANAVEDGYFAGTREIDFIHFLATLLDNLGFKDIKLEKRFQNYSIDIWAIKEEKEYIFEVKTYRTKSVSPDLIKSASHQIFMVAEKYKKAKPILITTSFVDKDLKKEILSKLQIEIWDIANLIYLGNFLPETSETLSFYIPYTIHDIEPVEPPSFLIEQNETLPSNTVSYYQTFEKRLANCPPGKENNEDKEFEKICTDILVYLFSSEFFQISTQHQTNDDLFRMDMICSLKGTTEFWKFLMQFYNTKFVVFEFKNYSKKITQNLLFIASKYLFPEALRNVCFIISRKGCDENAQKVIDSKIKSEKKLLISLTDQDLLVMIAKKEQGKDPSDYLLEKVEKMLMSLSIY